MQNLGPINTPPPDRAVLSDELADLMGSPVRKGDVVLYVCMENEEWASLVVQVKDNGHLDIVTFRPDGNNVRYWDVPPRIGDAASNYWRLR